MLVGMGFEAHGHAVGDDLLARGRVCDSLISLIYLIFSAPTSELSVFHFERVPDVAHVARDVCKTSQVRCADPDISIGGLGMGAF